MKKKFLIAGLVYLGSIGIFLLGCALKIPESNFIVKGVVRDAFTGRHIEGARVTDEQYGKEHYQGTITDTEGKYRYLTWYEEHSIVAEACGYKTQRQLLKTKFLGKERERILDFELIPE